MWFSILGILFVENDCPDLYWIAILKGKNMRLRKIFLFFIIQS